MNPAALRQSELEVLENILKKQEIDVGFVDNETKNILDKLGTICRISKPVGVPASRINAALLDIEHRILLKGNHLDQLKLNVTDLTANLAKLTSLQQDIGELNSEIDLRVDELGQDNSSESLDMNELEMENLQSEVAQLNLSLEKSGVSSCNIDDIKNEYNEYLKLVAEAASYTNRISTIPVQCGVSLEKTDLENLLQRRNACLNQLIGEVYEKST